MQQQKVLRAGQDELARFVLLIHDGLYIGEQVWRSLGLVQDDGAIELRQEPPRIFQRERPLIRQLEGDVGIVREL